MSHEPVSGGTVDDDSSLAGESTPSQASIPAWRTVWSITELREQILAHLARNHLAVLARVSKEMFELAVRILYSGRRFGLREFREMCDGADNSRRGIYLDSVREVWMNKCDIETFMRLFSRGHRLEYCGIYAGNLVATIEWARTSTLSKGANVDIDYCDGLQIKVNRHLHAEIKPLDRQAILAMCLLRSPHPPMTDNAAVTVEWSASVRGNGVDDADWFKQLAQPSSEVGVDREWLETVRLGDCTLEQLSAILLSERWRGRDRLIGANRSDGRLITLVRVFNARITWTHELVAQFVEQHASRIESLYLVGDTLECDVADFFFFLARSRRYLALLRRFQLEVRLRSDGIAPPGSLVSLRHTAPLAQRAITGRDDDNMHGNEYSKGDGDGDDVGNDEHTNLQAFTIRIRPEREDNVDGHVSWQDRMSFWIRPLVECMLDMAGPRCECIISVDDDELVQRMFRAEIAAARADAGWE